MGEELIFEYTGKEILLANETLLRNYNRWIVQQFAKYWKKNVTIKTTLDFGAGVGTLGILFKEMTNQLPISLEIDGSQRDILLRRGFIVAKGIDEVSQEIGFVYSSNVLEHIEDDLAALISIRKKMSRDGRLALYVPAFESIWTKMDDNVGHYRRYTKASLQEKLIKAGFEVESICYSDPIGFVLAKAFKLIGSESGNPGDRSLLLFDRVLFPVSALLDRMTRHVFGKNVLAFAHVRR